MIYLNINGPAKRKLVVWQKLWTAGGHFSFIEEIDSKQDHGGDSGKQQFLCLFVPAEMDKTLGIEAQCP
jgi:hypothetical protein